MNRQDNFKPQLYNLSTDPLELKDVSAEHPAVVEELKGLLQLYRESGYSRELPTAEKIAAASAIPALSFPIESLPSEPWRTDRGKWETWQHRRNPIWTNIEF